MNNELLWTQRADGANVWLLQGLGDRRDLSVLQAPDETYTYVVWTSRDATYSNPMLTVNGFADALTAQAVAAANGVVSDVDELALKAIRDAHVQALDDLIKNYQEAEKHIRGAYEAELALWWYDNRKGSPREVNQP